MTKFQKILVIIIATIIFFLALTSLFGFIFMPDKIGSSFRKKEPTIEQASVKQEKNDLSVFSSIGRLRLLTSDNKDITIILKPYFFYPSSDKDFYEELVTKNQKMRFLISEYFENKSFDFIKTTKEMEIKKELLEILNESLVMGKIQDLYFDEYIFLD